MVSVKLLNIVKLNYHTLHVKDMSK